MRESRRSRSAWSNRESAHESLSHKLKKPREFHGEFNKKHGYIVIISILLIAIILGSPAIFNSVASHSSNGQIAKQDAAQPIWNDNLASGDTSGFKTLNAAFVNVFGVAPSIQLNPTTVQSAAIISNIKVDLSVASSRELFLHFDFEFGSICPPNQALFGFFLTRFPASNSSRQIPINYDPRNDANVSLVQEFSANDANCNGVAVTLIQRNDNRTVIQDFQGGSTGGSDYLQTVQSTLLHNSGNFQNPFQLQLNYTGNAGSPSSVSSFTWDTGTTVTTQIFPPLPLNQYYVGMFALQNANNNYRVNFLGDLANSVVNGLDCRPVAGFGNSRSCMNISWNVPAVSVPVVVPQTPDTSGFFGPLIKWIISGFVFVYQNLVQFLVWLESILSPELSLIITVFSVVFVAVFNAIGSLWGDNAFGNHVLSFISNLVTYFASVLTGALGFLPTAVTFLTNALSIFTTFFLGGNSFIGLWTSLLSAIASAITQLNGFLQTLLYFLNLGLFGMNVIFTFMTALLCLAALVDWEETENPLAGFITIVLAFFLFYVLAFGGSTISPVATNATVQANYQTAWNNVKFLVQIMPLLFFSMITEYAVSLADNPRLHRQSNGFMPSFQSLLKFYVMVTVDIFKGGYWFFSEGYDITSKAIAALKGRWSPVEVAGTG